MNIRIDSHIKPPRPGKMKRKAEAKVKALFELYAEAYFALYQVKPQSYTWDGTYMHIGSSAGITLKRLKEMTSQLKYRKG